MVPLTRRRLLHGTVGVFVGISGCGSSPPDTATETASHPPNRDTGALPAHYALRHSDNKPTVWVPNEHRRSTTAAPSSTTAPPNNAERRGFVGSAETAEQLWFADVDGAAEARQFVIDTDFDTETVYVEFHAVRECQSQQLCSVTWSQTDIHTQYGSYYRSADVSCRADARDGVSWLIRIPEALDPAAIRSHGSGWSSRGCQRRRHPPDDNGTTTDAPTFGPKTSANGTETSPEGSR